MSGQSTSATTAPWNVHMVGVPDTPVRDSILAYAQKHGLELVERTPSDGEAVSLDCDFLIIGLDERFESISDLEALIDSVVGTANLIVIYEEGREDELRDVLELGVDQFLPTSAGNSLVDLVFHQLMARTERMLVEKPLRYPRETLLKALPDLVMVLDREGKYIEAFSDRSAERLFVRPPEELIGSYVHDFFPKKYADGIVQTVNDVLRTGENQVFRYPLKLDGEERWFSGHAAILSEHTRDRVIWVARDITDTHSLELDVRDTRILLQTAFDSLPMGIFWKDRDLTFLGMNQACLDAIGVSSVDDVIGKTDFDFDATRPHAEWYRKIDQQVIESGEPHLGIVENLGENDEPPRWVRTNKLPLRTPQGEIVGILGSFEDVTKEQELIEELEHTNQLLNEAQSLARIGSWMYVQSTAELTWTHELYRLYERDPAKGPLDSVELSSYYPDQHDAEQLQQLILTCIRNGHAGELELWMTDGSGERRRVRHVVQRISDDVTIGFMQDVTEAKERELAHRLATTLLESTQEVSSVGSWEWDLITNSLQWSDEMYEIFDVSPEQALDFEESTKFWGEEEAERMHGLLMRCVEQGESYSEVTEYIHPDGTKRYAQATGRALRDSTGEIVKVIGTFQDITEREKIRAEAERRERLLRQTTQLSGVGGWRYDLETDQIEPTDGARGILAFDDDYVLSLSEGVELVHEDDRAIARKSLQACLKDRQPFTEEVRMRRLDGKEIWCRISGEPDIRDNEVVGLYGAMQDITEERQQLAEAEWSARLMRQTTEVSGVGGWHYDFETDQFEETKGARGILGFDEDTMLALSEAVELVHEDDRDIASTSLRRCLEYGEPYTEEIRIMRTDGTEIWCRVSGEPDMREGKVVGIYGAIQDITEEREQLAYAEWSARLLEQTANVSGIGGWRYSIQEDEMEFTPKFREIVGISHDRSISLEDAYRMCHEEDQEVAKKAVERCIEDGDRIDLTIRTNRANGEEFWAHVTGAAKFDEGEPVEIFGAFEDVTEERQRRAEQQAFERRVQHAQKLESLGVLAGGIAHDFNNLLVSMMGYASMAIDELEEDHPARELVRNVLSGSQKAADLTKQLLAYSGKGRFVLEEVNINALVKEMSDILRVALPKGVILEEEYGEDIPAISADRSQLAQVLMNLITNAGESIGTRSGTVTIETELVDADEEYFDGSEWHSKAEPGHYIKLSVTDDGEGMDEETRSKIFEPFFTTKFTGRGLGLAAVLGIVRGHEGTLRVRSKPGDGTTFDVLLPASEAPAERATEAPSEFEKAELDGTALVIDDERSIRSIAKRILEMAGMEVLTAEDGPGGLELYEQDPNGFAVVLLDMTMPGMSGHEAFERIRKIKPDQCVVLSSGYAEQDAVSRFEGDQLSGFIQKPYKPTELVEAIERAIASPLGPPAE